MTPRWSPDSKKIAYADKRMNLWLVDLDDPGELKIDSDRYDTPFHNLDPAWSPDSRWIAYTKQLRNYLRAVFVYSLEEKKSRQVTDGRSDALSPRFDRDGKYLYFIASTSAGLSQGWLDMTSMARPVTSSVYAAVLRKDLPSPVAPESDEEGERTPRSRMQRATRRTPSRSGSDGEEERQAGGQEGRRRRTTRKTRRSRPSRCGSTSTGLDQRIVALPIERRELRGLEAGAEGVLFLVANPIVLTDEDYTELERGAAAGRLPLRPEDAQGGEAAREDRRRQPPSTAAAATFVLSADGTKMLFSQGRSGSWRRRTRRPNAGEGGLKADDRGLRRPARRVAPDVPRGLAPRARLPLRAELPRPRPGRGRAGLRAVRATGIASREDLNELFREMTGHLVVGHTFVAGGWQPKQDAVSVGLLGADYRVVDGPLPVRAHPDRARTGTPSCRRR